MSESDEEMMLILIPMIDNLRSNVLNKDWIHVIRDVNWIKDIIVAKAEELTIK